MLADGKAPAADPVNNNPRNMIATTRVRRCDMVTSVADRREMH
jgi:hypothetical protein